LSLRGRSVGNEDASPPGRFTRGLAFALRGFALFFALLATAMRWLLWLPALALDRLYRYTATVYEPLLAWSLRHRAIVIVGALSIFAGTMLLIPRLGTELIPQLSQGEFDLQLRLAPGSPLADTDRAIGAAQVAASGIDEVALTYSVAGTGNRLDANPVDAGEHSGTLSVTLKPGAGRDAEQKVMAALRSEVSRIPGIHYEFSRPSLMSFASPLQIEIAGYDLQGLERSSNAIVRELGRSDRFADVRSSFEQGNPEIQIEFDQERAARLGLSVRDIADRVVANVRGEIATRYTWRDRKIDVLVRSVDTQHSSIDEIRGLVVNPESGRPVTLDAVANISVALGPAEIRRIAQQRVAIVSANLAYGDLGAAAIEAQNIIDRLNMPSGLVASVAGQNEEKAESFRSMQFALALAIFLVYLVMASQF
ncbi:MAG: efflux RND transporter permease subunit, partial [Halioglobus sp.]|nr:efflux RND transporter permease subunit [Halioglobus sp.]